METKVCKCCGRELTTDKFVRNGWGITDVCIDCANEKRKENREKKKALKQQAVDAVNARALRLHDFLPRELMEELKRRGYEGKLRFVQVHEIDLSSI